MPVYTVHAPLAALAEAQAGNDAATSRFELVRDGFHVWAALAAMLWLIYHRLWLALIGYVVVAVGIEVSMILYRVPAGAQLSVLALLALLVGFEAASLRRWTLSRRKWRQIDVVVADNEEAAERRFFERWAENRDRGIFELPVDRASPPPVRSPAADKFSRPAAPPPNDVIGLFPQPGAPR